MCAASLAARFAGEDGAFEREAAAEMVEAPLVPVAAAAAGLAILVAEDNDINALLIRSLLSRLDHRPEIAPDGTAAIDCWNAARAAGKS